MNNLLNAGEVPNLFALDEKQEICEKMRVFDRYDAALVTQIEQKPAVTGIPIHSIPCIFIEPALSWLDSLVGRTLLWYRRGHCFESRSSLIFLRFNFTAVYITAMITDVFISFSTVEVDDPSIYALVFGFVVNFYLSHFQEWES